MLYARDKIFSVTNIFAGASKYTMLTEYFSISHSEPLPQRIHTHSLSNIYSSFILSLSCIYLPTQCVSEDGRRAALDAQCRCASVAPRAITGSMLSHSETTHGGGSCVYINTNRDTKKIIIEQIIFKCIWRNKNYHYFHKTFVYMNKRTITLLHYCPVI